ncbi:hypothetical protein Pelo_12250 [Pelomyxa schiedti]|nr:hypothetical protein Pelo_12250 [Pelomyxa schiedti]
MADTCGGGASLSYEQETYLKKLLVENAIAHELGMCCATQPASAAVSSTTSSVGGGGGSSVAMRDRSCLCQPERVAELVHFVDSQTVLLSFLHKHLSSKVPLFAGSYAETHRSHLHSASSPSHILHASPQHSEASSSLDLFLTALPRINAHAKRATKRDQQATNATCSALLDLFVRTKKERDGDMARYQDLGGESTRCQNTAVTQGSSHSQVHQESRTDFLNAVICLSMHLTTISPETFRATWQHCPSASSLPPVYENSLTSFCSLIRQATLREMTTPAKVAKFSHTMKMLPKSAIVGATALASPSLIVKGVVSLLLSRPLGTRSVMQRLIEGSTEVRRTESEVASLRIDISKSFGIPIVEKMSQWFSLFDGPLPKEEEMKTHLKMVLCDSRIPPSLATTEIDSLEHDKVLQLYKFLLLEARLADKIQFIELIGSAEMIKLYKEVLPSIYKPLHDLLSRGGIPGLTSGVFTLLKRYLAVSQKLQETKSPTSSTVDEYAIPTREFENKLFEFVRNVIVSDGGWQTVEPLLSWWLQTWNQFCIKSPLIVDLESILNSLPDEPQQQESPLDADPNCLPTKQRVLQQLDLYVTFKKQEKQARLCGATSPPPTNTDAFRSSALRDLFTSRVREAVERAEKITNNACCPPPADTKT